MSCKYRFGLLVVCCFMLHSLSVLAHPPITGNLLITVKNVFGTEPLVLNERLYATPNGDSIYVSNYKYYISNIRLLTADGKQVTEPESYHLVNEGRSSSKKFSISVPEGTYTSIEFMIGVDSLHNVSGAQTDALDPINAMYWDWHTGYIMAKLEGRFNNTEQSEYSFHIGGFAGKNNTVRPVTLDFARPVTISAGKSAGIVLTSDVGEWFKTPHKIELAKMPVVATEGGDAVQIADNYSDMFSLSHAE